jgi:hypothetical protein
MYGGATETLWNSSGDPRVSLRTSVVQYCESKIIVLKIIKSGKLMAKVPFMKS